MAHSRTVYCSFCGERGHNRTGCPKRKQYIKDNPNSWEAIKEQRKQHRRDEIKAKGGRKCSYCGNRGHTTRTCEVKKQDRARLIEALVRERKLGLKRLNELGWGVGALFERASRWTEQKTIYMVDKIEWEHWDDSDMVTLRGLNVAKATSNEPHDWKHPRQVSITLTLIDDEREYNQTPICPTTAPQKAPEDFLNGTKFSESQYFPKGSKRPYVHKRIEETGRP